MIDVFVPAPSLTVIVYVINAVSAVQLDAFAKVRTWPRPDAAPGVILVPVATILIELLPCAPE